MSSFVSAQEIKEEEHPNLTVGADMVSRYVWRGTDFGNAPAIQPTLEYSKKGFSVGAWGSYSLSSNTGGLEADLYVSYAFDFGLSLSITDYYFPGEQLINDNNALYPLRNGSYFDGSSHILEAGVGYGIGDLSLSANYMFVGAEQDMYFEAKYAFGPFAAFVGAGNEQYTSDNSFTVCNVGISASKDIHVSDKWTLPVSSTFILNPDTEQVHLVFDIGIY